MDSKSKRDSVADFFRLIGERRPKDGLKYFAADCIQHNPYVKGGMDALVESMMAAMKDMPPQFTDPELKVRYILADGEFVVAYTQLLGSKRDPSKGGLRQVHLFRFNGDKIAEYWDVTQAISADMPNPANAF
ncbi:MAG TPA: nuclear transport factor 2 family protein [Nitrososphaerales archaeon]|nr:nuclear transport factor 2 family protein [Nitrososphaerales archaeon]